MTTKEWNKVKAVSFRVQETVEVKYIPVYNMSGRDFQASHTGSIAVVKASNTEHKKHDFELGLGPCGETVRELYYREDSQGFQVYQVTERSRKNFVYPWAELHGRLTVTYLLQTETLPH